MIIPNFQDKLQELKSQNFLIKEDYIGDDLCYLILPQHNGIHFTKDNLIFRSSMWNSQGELISASYKKFFNWGEQSVLIPEPIKLKNCKLMEKVDGSTLIISYYKNNLIIRTRGTFDATTLENGYEIAFLKEKYPKIFECPLLKGGNCSFIFEWVTPNNQIVIKYPEPDIYLTNIISHIDYGYLKQVEVDEFANLLDVKRPKIYNYKTVQCLLNKTKKLIGEEGLCVYFNKDQDIKKVKSDWYLKLHFFKSTIGIETLLDICLNNNLTEYHQIYDYLLTQFDYEIVESCRGYISEIADRFKNYNKMFHHLVSFVEPLKNFSRKDAANKINSAYTGQKRALAYILLDDKLPDNKLKKYLIL